jgi:hypothetical protein
MRKPVFDPADFRNGSDPWEGLIRRIMRAAAVELERRRQEQSLLFVLSRWSRPVIASAAAMVLVFGTVLAASRGDEPAIEVEPPTLAHYLIAEDLRPVFVQEDKPTLAEFVSALEGGQR